MTSLSEIQSITDGMDAFRYKGRQKHPVPTVFQKVKFQHFIVVIDVL